MSGNSVGIVIPAHNNGQTISRVLGRLVRVTRNWSRTIVVVDDCSTDDTAIKARKYTPHVVSLKKNCGVGAATKEGFRRLAELGPFDFIIKLDADGQHDPKHTLRVLKSLEDGADLVVCSRFHPESEQISTPLNRFLLNFVYAKVISIVVMIEVTDARTGFMGFQGRYLPLLAQKLIVQRYGVPMEIILRIWVAGDQSAWIDTVPHQAIYGSRMITPKLRQRYRQNGESITEQVERYREALEALELILEDMGLAEKYQKLLTLLKLLEPDFVRFLQDLTPETIETAKQHFTDSLIAVPAHSLPSEISV